MIPELSHYQVGEAPLQGTYLIEEIDGTVQFTVGWTGADGQNQSIGFGAPATGEQVTSDFAGVDTFSVLHEDDNTLLSDAVIAGVVVSKAVRRVSTDGSLMSVLQENADGQGGWIRIVQVYKRIG